jgi:hypothetical protein
MVPNLKAMENAQMKQQKVMVVWQCGHSKRGIMSGTFNLYKQVGLTILTTLLSPNGISKLIWCCPMIPWDVGQEKGHPRCNCILPSDLHI